MEHRPSKMLALLGCGRSGTKYLAKVFTELGLPVGHEELKSCGISSWYLYPGADRARRGPAWNEIPWDMFAKIHVVRDPLRVIPSMMTSNWGSQQFIRERTSASRHQPLMEQFARYWVEWNRAIEAIEPDMRIAIPVSEEDLARVMALVNVEFPFEELRAAMEQSQGENDKHQRLLSLFSPWSGPVVKWRLICHAFFNRPLTWDEVDRRMPQYADKLREAAVHFGFNT